jgi:hypothetical protein
LSRSKCRDMGSRVFLSMCRHDGCNGDRGERQRCHNNCDDSCHIGKHRKESMRASMSPPHWRCRHDDCNGDHYVRGSDAPPGSLALMPPPAKLLSMTTTQCQLVSGEALSAAACGINRMMTVGGGQQGDGIKRGWGGGRTMNTASPTNSNKGLTKKESGKWVITVLYLILFNIPISNSNFVSSYDCSKSRYGMQANQDMLVSTSQLSLHCLHTILQ